MVDDVVYANLLLYMQSLLNMAILTLDLDPCHPHILNKHSNLDSDSTGELLFKTLMMIFIPWFFFMS